MVELTSEQTIILTINCCWNKLLIILVAIKLVVVD